MKNRCSWFLALVLLLSAGAFSQDSARQDSAGHVFSKKAVSLFGAISDDGKFFLADPDAAVWSVSNPDLIKAQHGQRVSLQAQTNDTMHELRVLRVRPRERQVSMANLGDSAFRR